MSEAPSSAKTADSDPELEGIANELYALRTDDFAAARDEQVRKARAEGKQPLARELAKLRRPTQSAWLINLLWRDQRDVMQQLFQLADELSRAQANASGRELQSLTAQRRELEAALLRRARALAEQAGVTVSASMEREAQETLSAALAVPEVANEVRTGRLVKPAAYAGFGMLPTPGLSPAAVQPPREEPPSTRAPTSEPVDIRAAQRARERREEAERLVEEARAAEKTAAESLADWERAAVAAQEHHQDLRSQLEQLEKQLRDFRVQVATAEDAAQSASRRRDQADREHQTAVRSFERAQHELNGLK